MNNAKKMWEEMNEDSNLLISFMTVAIAFFGSIFVVVVGIVALAILQKIGVSIEIMKVVAALVVVAPLLLIILNKKINDFAKSIVNFGIVKSIAFDLQATTLQP
ncbi:MAG: hypothetical protein PXX73_06235, partial [Sideroxydans sp.]|nr:hypothetical protein [Sideroxydans sp.]